MICPPSLKKGDTLLLVSPAKAIEEAFVINAKNLLEKRGYKVELAKCVSTQKNYFSGTDQERTADMQWAIDHSEAKAIICCRGGYGAIRVMQQLNWANWLREPKWLIGFSDITNFHLMGLKLGIESIHGTMPLNYQENSAESFETLFSILETNTVSFNWNSSNFNKIGEVKGTLIGGNLSILYSLLGTPLCPKFENAILFVEDLSEQIYHIDRMLQAFKLAGVFEQISGLIVGGMTDLHDTAIPTNYSVETLFIEALSYRKIPMCFNAPIGHINDNRAVICGRKGQLKVLENSVSISQL